MEHFDRMVDGFWIALGIGLGGVTFKWTGRAAWALCKLMFKGLDEMSSWGASPKWMKGGKK